MTSTAAGVDDKINLGATAVPALGTHEVNGQSQRYAAKSILHLFADTLRLPSSIILSSFAINVLSLALPLVILQIFDRVIRYQSYNTLFLLIVGLFLVIIAETGLRLARNRLVSDIALKEGYELQMRAGKRLLNMPYSTSARLSPAVAGDAIGAIDEINQFSGGNARLAILDLPFVLLFLGIIWLIGGIIVIVPVMLIAGFAIWTLWSRAAIKPVLLDQMDRQRQRFSFYAECIQGFSTVKSLAVEPQMQRRFERILRDAAPANYALTLQTNRMVSAAQLFASLTLISVITVGAIMAINGILSIGAVAACSLISNRIAQPVLRIIGVWGQLETAKLALERSQAVMNLPQRQADIEPVKQPAKVQLNGVAMGDAGQRDKHHGVNLTVSPGEITGIIIRNHRQRETMARLLLGQTAPDRGKVLIDGVVPSDDSSDAALQGALFVDGHPAIFQGTIAENMSMFGCINPAATIELAQRLGVEPVMQRLPQGYQTMLSDVSATKLPQDILLAIALVRAAAIGPRLLVLDVRRSVPADICANAFDGLIEELRGSTTIIILGRTLTDSITGIRNYTMHDWSMEALGPLPKNGNKRGEFREERPNV